MANNKKYKVGKSKIQGKGIFSKQDLNIGDHIGKVHTIKKLYTDYDFTDLGRNHNHSENPNVQNVLLGNERHLFAIKPIKKGEELTSNYRLQPDLEQPEDFEKAKTGKKLTLSKAQNGGWLSKYDEGGELEKYDESGNDEEPCPNGQVRVNGKCMSRSSAEYAAAFNEGLMNLGDGYVTKSWINANFKPHKIVRDDEQKPATKKKPVIQDVPLTYNRPNASESVNFGAANPQYKNIQLKNANEALQNDIAIEEIVKQTGIDREHVQSQLESNKLAAASVKNQGTIKPAEERSGLDKTWAIASHPMTALKYKVKGQNIPDYFERGEKNPLDLAVNIFNPATYINSEAAILDAQAHPIETVKTLTKAGVNLVSNLVDDQNIFDDESNSKALELIGDVGNMLMLSEFKPLAQSLEFKLSGKLKSPNYFNSEEELLKFYDTHLPKHTSEQFSSYTTDLLKNKYNTSPEELLKKYKDVNSVNPMLDAQNEIHSILKKETNNFSKKWVNEYNKTYGVNNQIKVQHKVPAESNFKVKKIKDYKINKKDYTKPLETKEDYINWGNVIHPDINYIFTPRQLKKLHKEAINYFKKSIPGGDISSVTGKEMSMYIRDKVADKLPSLNENLIIDESGNAVYLHDTKPHPSLSGKQEVYRKYDIKTQPPISDWNYNLGEMTPQQRNIVVGYARGYDANINSAFRYPTVVSPTSEYYKALGEELNNAILKNKIPEATSVRRGIQGGDYDVQLLDPVTYQPIPGKIVPRSNLQVGDVFRDDAFLSTSFDLQHHWGSPSLAEKVNIPGGSVQSYAFPNSLSHSPFPTEKEVILPKGLIRRVEAIADDPYKANYKYETSILNPYKKGGWLRKYQNGGEVETSSSKGEPFTQEELNKNYSQAKEWLKNWYEGRKSIPEFKQTAKYRIAALKRKDFSPMVNLSKDQLENFGNDDVNAAAREAYGKIYVTDPNDPFSIQNPDQARVNASVPVLTHELTHALDNRPSFGILGMQRDYQNQKIDKSQFAGQEEARIEPELYPWITKAYNVKMQDPKNPWWRIVNPKMMNKDVFPEANAVLNMLRQGENMDPTKVYTPEDMQQIIDKYSNMPLPQGENMNVDEHRTWLIRKMFRLLKNDPKAIADFHNSTVSTDNVGDMTKGKNGSVESRQAGYTNIPFKYNSAWGGQFQNGGKLTDEQLDSLNKAKMKAKMALAAEFGNPSAKRMVSHVPPTYRFTGNEMINGENVVGFGENQVRLPGTGTHFMSSMGEFAVPYIQQDDRGNMIFKSNASPRDREAIRFGNPEDAQYFAEHYKDVAPMMQNFAMGGSIPQAQLGIFGRRNNELDCPKWGGCGDGGSNLGEFFSNIGSGIGNFAKNVTHGIGDLFHHKSKKDKQPLNNKGSLTDTDGGYSGQGWTPSGPTYIPDGLTQRFIPDFNIGRDLDISRFTNQQSTTPVYGDSIVSKYISPEGKGPESFQYTAQMGASIPGSVGFTYARTQGIPSEGPYARKTMPSAQDGMTYYQHGLDWKPKTISKNGSAIPKAQLGYVQPTFSDSLNIYNRSVEVDDYFKKKGYTKGPVLPSPSQAAKEMDDFMKWSIEDTKKYTKDPKVINNIKKGIEKKKKENVKAAKQYEQDVKNKKFPKYKDVLKENRDRYKKATSNPIINATYEYEDKSGKLIKGKGAPYKEYYSKTGPYQFEQREGSFGHLDLNAPRPLYDERIVPQNYYVYESNPNNKNYHDKVELFTYDPLAVKPYDMRTEEEKIKWEELYGDKENINENINRDQYKGLVEKIPFTPTSTTPGIKSRTFPNVTIPSIFSNTQEEEIPAEHESFKEKLNRWFQDRRDRREQRRDERQMRRGESNKSILNKLRCYGANCYNEDDLTSAKNGKNIITQKVNQKSSNGWLNKYK